MTRIDDRFAALKAQGKKAFVAYMMASDPDDATALQIMRGLPDAGVDIIELGMPFTDPMADGSTIQAAGQRALAQGGSVSRTLDIVREFRRDDTTTPIVLMGYYNPIYARKGGVTQFLTDAVEAGIDGLIVVDLPPEEDSELCVPATAAGLNFIRLATPTTDDRRLPAVVRNITGFVYYVSVTGSPARPRQCRRRRPRGRAHPRRRRPAGGRGLWHLDPRGRRGDRVRRRRLRRRQRHRQADRRGAPRPGNPGLRPRPGRGRPSRVSLASITWPSPPAPWTKGPRGWPVAA